MANLSITFSSLILLLSILYMFGTVAPTVGPPHPPGPPLSRLRSRSKSHTQSYLQASCAQTRYPSLCMEYLSTSKKTIRTPQDLAHAALYASLCRAKSTKSYLWKVLKHEKAMKAKEYQRIKDCLDQLNDGVDQIEQSIAELQRLAGKEHATSGGVVWHISNVETWTSAALTNANNCVDEFPGKRMSKLKATIKGKVLNVAQSTSNALALFHQYAARYRAASNP
ncbi:Plant invertase/pectin methylesterase inhibitor superfamily protein [Euphorbia peplus]|nr:Plant invertase/pectin methylesterase inhibitor superfamily protein [Euphorbia peplus]